MVFKSKLYGVLRHICITLFEDNLQRELLSAQRGNGKLKLFQDNHLIERKKCQMVLRSLNF